MARVQLRTDPECRSLLRARVFPRVRADTRILAHVERGSSLSLTSLAGGAPLAGLNCTRRRAQGEGAG